MSDTNPSVEVVARVLGMPVMSIEPLIVENGGCHSMIFTIQSESGDYILRIPKGQQGFHTAYVRERIPLANWFDQEWATSQARDVGIPAPEIVYSGRSASESERFVIMNRLPGKYISDYEKWNGCPYDESEFGSILAKLHAVTPNGYGPIDDFGSAYFTTWAEFLTTAAQSMVEKCRKRGSISEEVCRKLRSKWLLALSRLESDRPALLHMEALGFANILYDPETRRITGFLDFEDCIGGDPLYELEWMCYYYGSRESKQRYFNYGRFEETYGPWPADHYRSLLYKPLMYLYKLTWIDVKSERARDHMGKISECLDKI